MFIIGVSFIFYLIVFLFSRQLPLKRLLQKTIEQISLEYGVVSSQIYKWRKELVEHGADVFSSKREPSTNNDVNIDKLHATIGRLKVENDFLEKVLKKYQ